MMSPKYTPSIIRSGRKRNVEKIHKRKSRISSAETSLTVTALDETTSPGMVFVNDEAIKNLLFAPCIITLGQHEEV
jgi:hypothetical protein